jgi:hypothetical protein
MLDGTTRFPAGDELAEIAEGEATRQVLRTIATWDPDDREAVVAWASSEIGADPEIVEELVSALEQEARP